MSIAVRAHSRFTSAASHVDRASHAVVLDAARALVASLSAEHPVLLAVSGGCDSMVLLDGIDSVIGSRPHDSSLRALVVVATFDHATGPAATRAADLVEAEAKRRGFRVHRGRANGRGTTEASWRAARWSFLLGARAPGGVVATAHTLDDQLETVVIRCLRGAGARGLAGLAAERRDIIRPFIAVPRTAVRRYAEDHRIAFVDDPSNDSRAHLRNRVRLDLLPAIRRVRPEFGTELLGVAARAAAWRRDVERWVLRYVSESPDETAFRVARHELATYDSAALCVLWPAIAARAGITLDRRGTRRLAQFTTEGASGARIQLSGGIEVVRERDFLVLRPLNAGPSATTEVPLVGIVELNGWRFAPVSAEEHPSRGSRVSNLADADAVLAVLPRGDGWTCDLPADCRLVVRAWQPADRMRWNVAGAARRVKRFLADAKIAGPSRIGWPVVLSDDEIVWIPGIRRSAAAPERSGRPVVRYICERFERGPRQVS